MCTSRKGSGPLSPEPCNAEQGVKVFYPFNTPYTLGRTRSWALPLPYLILSP